MRFVDERSEPSLRFVLVDLLNRAAAADIALQHLRLIGLDLTPRETSRFAKCRVMVGRFNIDSVLGSEQSAILRALALSGSLQIRTAPHHVWTPDFSIFRDVDGKDILVFGAHYFGRPYPLFGLALTAVTDDATGILRAGHRFEELWAAGYDVMPAILEHLAV